ncbi:MAG: formylmethanofuran dehydrogenase [Epulopiscium sp.]|nr:formylmethanofuran dehydrogenase [Candidatus Epulonipiscium sp.]
MEKLMWEKCADFHGHVCGGLTIGYKAALYAIELMDLKLDKELGSSSISSDEEIVCICENDACGVDAIQVILGCTIGKGNLLFHMTGKQAFSFYNRDTNQSVRLVLKSAPKGMTREESFDYYQSCKPRDMFDVKDTAIKLPEKAQIFRSIDCELCHERTSENMIRLEDGKSLCLDCYNPYTRFDL